MRIRVQHYLAFAARLHANVLAPDYRGFADSTGTPSEAGVVLDARAAWDWLRVRGAPPSSVLVVGSSLGTGVAVQFASAMEESVEDARKSGGVGWVHPKALASVRERPRGVVLLSPFSKLETLLDTYYILGLIPLFAPLRTVPYLASEFPPFISKSRKKKLRRQKDFVKGFMIHRFDSLAKVVVRAVLVLSNPSLPRLPRWRRVFRKYFPRKRKMRCCGFPPTALRDTCS
jgi:abhydrolase domain-containing protein 12